MTTNQLNILTQSIQQRNETGEPSLAKDVFEVFMKVAIDFSAYMDEDNYVPEDNNFEEFISQYNPQP